MREILFKAKRKDNGKWVEGFYYKMQETTYCFKEDYERNPVPIHHYILFEQMTDWGMPNNLYKVEIDETTLCQYTGLTDKNGNKIWENDVVKGKHLVRKGETVTFENGGFSPYSIMGWEVTPEGYETEVIGNIFDNPELLESEEM